MSEENLDGLLEILEHKIKGVTFRMRELSFDEARDHSEKSIALSKSEPTPKQWYDFAIAELANYLTDPVDITEEKLRKKLSRKQIEELYVELLLEAAGLERKGSGPAIVGEAAAA